jgi:Na+/H+ antiporter NhaC
MLVFQMIAFLFFFVIPGLFLLALLYFFLIKRRRQKRTKRASHDNLKVEVEGETSSEEDQEIIETDNEGRKEIFPEKLV